MRELDNDESLLIIKIWWLANKLKNMALYG